MPHHRQAVAFLTLFCMVRKSFYVPPRSPSSAYTSSTFPFYFRDFSGGLCASFQHPLLDFLLCHNEIGCPGHGGKKGPCQTRGSVNVHQLTVHQVASEVPRIVNLTIVNLMQKVHNLLLFHSFCIVSLIIPLL